MRNLNETPTETYRNRGKPMGIDGRMKSHVSMRLLALLLHRSFHVIMLHARGVQLLPRAATS